MINQIMEKSSEFEEYQENDDLSTINNTIHHSMIKIRKRKRR